MLQDALENWSIRPTPTFWSIAQGTYSVGLLLHEFLKEVLVTRAGIAGNCAKLAMFLEPKKLASSCYHRTWRARRENLQHTSQDKDGDDEPPSGSELDMVSLPRVL